MYCHFYMFCNRCGPRLRANNRNEHIGRHVSTTHFGPHLDHIWTNILTLSAPHHQQQQNFSQPPSTTTLTRAWIIATMGTDRHSTRFHCQRIDWQLGQHPSGRIHTPNGKCFYFPLFYDVHGHTDPNSLKWTRYHS